ncbi:hypothetical protein FRC09_011761 [Ceratobasidium sp. 395]|nr:hypothetical protein FRC09_011761 [Ceratobasidium sp. 395]
MSSPTAPQQHRPLGVFHPTHIVHERAHWSSRTWRKHRYPPGHAPAGPGSEWWTHDRGAVKRTTRLAGDISFWLAVVFVVGSIAWVINGFLLLLPILSPSKYPEHLAAASAWAFIGGTVFEVGSYLMFVEALNTGHDELFGEALKDEVDKLESRPQRKDVRFRWWGSTSWRNLGFLASSIQLVAATVFWISTLTGLPGVIPGLPDDPPIAISDVFYWTPQVIGGLGFVISSTLLMLEVQRAWWRPKLNSLGWYVGLFNLIGAIGFTLCGALGYAALSSSKAEYQSTLSTFWGGWAFLIGSGVQLWESVWRDVDHDENN